MTEIAAILNLTPDSFSDGGRFQGLKQITDMVEDACALGVEYIDGGACSTRPGATLLSAEEELSRLKLFLGVVKKFQGRIRFSIDTHWSAVAVRALDAGCDMINDVSCRDDDPDLVPLVAERGCRYVLMHNRGTPATMNQLTRYPRGIQQVIEEIDQRMEHLLQSGVRQEQLYIDPGLGFAKDEEMNRQILLRIIEFRRWQRPLYFGPSRKRFIGYFSGASEVADRDSGTLAVLGHLLDARVDVVRVHDYRGAVRYRSMWNALHSGEMS